MRPLCENIFLSTFTTLGVGGPARFFTEVETAADVEGALVYARTNRLPFFILGGGSNLVVADDGFPGLVALMKIAGVERSQEGSVVTFCAGAGEDWDGFVAQTVAANCGGLECLSGIPGTVGGTPVQNVGAYGQEVSETIRSVTVFDRHTSEVRILRSADCGFSYRTSVFNTTQRDRFVVLDVTYELHQGAAPKIEYQDLKKCFAGRPSPTLQEVRDSVRSIRRAKGMLLVEGDPDVRSAGSFFKNPIVSIDFFHKLTVQVEAHGWQLPSFPAGDRQVKLSAAWLVEKAGFQKGYVHGRVGISTKHTLAIVNRGGATAADVLSLMSLVRETVFARFCVELHPEPVFLGFERSPVTGLASGTKTS